ncbi:MAG TPA: hypothetical protein VLL77_01175 [Anaerolineales bacterium]|nr:hypothetical protein [Anaerolineales bacterium]
MSTASKGKAIPIYSTVGDWCALLVFPNLFSPAGEWIGWVTPDRQVYDVHGLYVGWLTADPRILRKRTYDTELERRIPPIDPGRIRPPATVPLPPMMSSLPFEVVDVLEEEPDRLHTVDAGELKDDVD